MGLAYIRDHEPEGGIREFRRALELDPKYLPARYGLGVFLLGSGRTREAIRCFDEARKQSPRDPRVWANLADAQFSAGDRLRAVETTRSAIRAIPNDPRLAVTLAGLYVHHQEIQTARDLLEDAYELTPEDAEVQLLLVKASLLAGEPLEALTVLKRMPSEVGKQGERSLLMGEALALTGNLDAAALNLAAALRSSPEDVHYLETYAWLQQLRGSFDEAIGTLKRAMDLDPKDPFIPYRIGVSYYFLEQLPQAEMYCRDALQLSPRYAAANFLLGILKVKQNNFEAAQSDLQQAVALNPKEGLFHRELGVALFKGGKLEEAGNELDQALTLDPKDAAGYFWQAKLLTRQGARQKAIAELNAAVEISPGFLVAYSELARLYTQVGQAQQAATVLAIEKKVKTSSNSMDSDHLLRTLPDATR